MREESTIEVALKVLEKNKSSLDIFTLFKKISETVEINEDEYDQRLAQFYTHLTMDGRFVILSDGSWDLRENHPFEVVNIVTTDFDLDLEEDEEEDEDDYEGMEVTVIKSEDEEEDHEIEKEKIKDIIGIV